MATNVIVVKTLETPFVNEVRKLTMDTKSWYCFSNNDFAIKVPFKFQDIIDMDVCGRLQSHHWTNDWFQCLWGLLCSLIGEKAIPNGYMVVKVMDVFIPFATFTFVEIIGDPIV
jgi:hypothetical protein